MMISEGTQRGFGLDDFLLVFRVRAKTGVLQLMHKDQHGVIYVVAGRVVDAVITLARGTERSVLADADDAMIEMLCWTDATFRFQYEPLVSRRTIRIRRESEWPVQEGTHRSGPDPATPSLSLDTHVHLEKVLRGGRHGVMLTATQWQVLSATGSGLRQCTQADGLDAETVLHAAGELISLGLLETAEVPRAPRDLPMPAFAAVAPASAVGVPVVRQLAPMPIPEFAQAARSHSTYRHEPAGRDLSGPAAAAPVVHPRPPLAASGGAAYGTGGTTISAPPPVKRGMLNAIMSRIRSL